VGLGVETVSSRSCDRNPGLAPVALPAEEIEVGGGVRGGHMNPDLALVVYIQTHRRCGVDI
jgi:hypothetical protein